MTGKVAFLWDGHFVYWRSIILAFAVLTAILAAVAVCLWQRKKVLAALLAAIPFAVVFSLLFGRLIDWYCRYESYASLASALLDWDTGGCSLIGAFFGTLLACSLARLVRLTDDLPALLDVVSPAAALGIAVGRSCELYSAADRGNFLITDAARQGSVFASAVTNPASGAVEWRFAVFAAQGIYCAVLFIVLILSLTLDRRRRSGDAFLLFLTLYCLGQILLDSARYDALHLRGNGFISLEQIVCAVTAAAVAALWSVRSVRRNGLRGYHPALWAMALLGLGLAGFAEWYVQREGDQYAAAYAVMAAGLFSFFCAAAALQSTARPASRREKRPLKRGPVRAILEQQPAEDAEEPSEENRHAEQLETLP